LRKNKYSCIDFLSLFLSLFILTDSCGATFVTPTHHAQAKHKQAKHASARDKSTWGNTIRQAHLQDFAMSITYRFPGPVEAIRTHPTS
jgi:hypothetical protein